MINPFAKFQYRSNEEEIMDDLFCKGEVVEKTLKELDLINLWLGGNEIVLRALEKLFYSYNEIITSEPIKIIDLGCGSGTMLKQISSLAKKMKVPVILTGVDANPFIIEYALKNCKQDNPEIGFEVKNVLSEMDNFSSQDIVLCSLFCHHFNDDELSKLIKNLKDIGSKTVLINDIHRHWLAYYSIKYLTTLFSNSTMVKYDSKLSVLRAFKKSDLQLILKNAGVTNYSIRWRWAFRYEVLIDFNYL